MGNLFRAGIGIVCLGCSAAVFAQTYDDLADDTANCRAVVARANIDGTDQQIVGRACLQDDGTWQFVQSPDGSVLWYPAVDYPYADLGYWGPPLFIGAGVGFGSLALAEWLKARSGDQVPARNPQLGKLKPLGDAPGTYVKVKS